MKLIFYLNGDFASGHFTEGELNLIFPDESYGTFFLVSADDLKNKSYGFGTNQSRKGWSTEYARENGLFVYGNKYGSHSPYWTRDQSTSDARHARCTKDEGELGRINVITEDLGMRPACWLDMTKVVIASGTGTLEDPYVLQTAAPQTDTVETIETIELTEAADNTENTDCNCVPEGEKCDCCDCCSCSLR